MGSNLVERLTKLGFSEYEAKAYMALLRENPVTGYQVAKRSGVPRSMIYEVMAKLTARGAAMTLRIEGGTKYAPVSPEEFFDQLYRDQATLIHSLRDDLSSLSVDSDLDYVWHIEGHENIFAKAERMITQAQSRISLALVSTTFPALRIVLEAAIARGVHVVIYTTADIECSGCRVVVAHVSKDTLGQAQGLGLILVADGAQVLIAEWLAATQARASWTSSSLLVFIAEHHLRTDLYLPQILEQLGEQALDLIHEEDRELFSTALESRIER